jgi:hypothetical protein
VETLKYRRRQNWKRFCICSTIRYLAVNKLKGKNMKTPTIVILSLALAALLGCGKTENTQSNAKEIATGKQFAIDVIAENDKSFGLAIKYNFNQPELCDLAVYKVSIESPNAPGPVSAGMPAPGLGSRGLIEITAEAVDNGLCMPTAYIGSIEFERGMKLPAIENGNFVLMINGIEYGIIAVSSETVKLQAAN